MAAPEHLGVSAIVTGAGQRQLPCNNNAAQFMIGYWMLHRSKRECNWMNGKMNTIFLVVIKI